MHNQQHISIYLTNAGIKENVLDEFVSESLIQIALSKHL